MNPLVLAQFTATSCIGTGMAATLASLAAQRSGLVHCEFESVTIDTHIGEVSGVDRERLPAAFEHAAAAQDAKMAHQVGASCLASHAWAARSPSAMAS